MSAYQVYARKYRPKQFEDVVGQETVITTLLNSIERNRVHHAYLFTGMRGVGKTTTARIFAKALNCEEGMSAHPCGKCASCKEIDLGISMTVKEIDGASYTGVDRIRELQEDAEFLPGGVRFKIYIIDEVHMLSKSAFNALLKILEEPPSYVKFIFATTELNKIPKTILSRCQIYNFRKVPLRQMVKTLRNIAGREHIHIEDDALEEIARNSDGALRDAERLFDQIISCLGESPTTEEVQHFLGVADKDVLSNLLISIQGKEYEQIISMYHNTILPKMEVHSFLSSLLVYIKDLTVFVALKDKSNNVLNYSDNNLERLRKTAIQFTIRDLEYLFSFFSRTVSEVRVSPAPEMYVEMMLIKACDMDFFHSLPEIVEKLKGNKDVRSLLQQKQNMVNPPAEPRSVSVDSGSAGSLSLQGGVHAPSMPSPPPSFRKQAAPPPVMPAPSVESVKEETAVTDSSGSSGGEASAERAGRAEEEWENILRSAAKSYPILNSMKKDLEFVAEKENKIEVFCRRSTPLFKRRIKDISSAIGEACRGILGRQAEVSFVERGREGGRNTRQTHSSSSGADAYEEERKSSSGADKRNGENHEEFHSKQKVMFSRRADPYIEQMKKAQEKKQKKDPHQQELVHIAINRFNGRVL